MPCTHCVQIDDPEFNLRNIHLRSLIEDGLSLKDWEKFVSHFQATLDQLEDIPAESKAGALAWLRSTREDFRPAEPAEVEHNPKRWPSSQPVPVPPPH